jgi:hypothetical protein
MIDTSSYKIDVSVASRTHLVIAFFNCRCVTTVPYVYGLHGTVVSVHVVYSTVRTMVGHNLLY